MNAQVLITSTSASSALEAISIPRSRTLPSMISASTKFLAQPKLIIPAFARSSGLTGSALRISGSFAGGEAAATAPVVGAALGKTAARGDCTGAAGAEAAILFSLGRAGAVTAGGAVETTAAGCWGLGA